MPRVDMALMGWVRVCQIHCVMSGLVPEIPTNEFQNWGIVWTLRLDLNGSSRIASNGCSIPTKVQSALRFRYENLFVQRPLTPYILPLKCLCE